jgi:hypothetical protein
LGHDAGKHLSKLGSCEGLCRVARQSESCGIRRIAMQPTLQSEMRAPTCSVSTCQHLALSKGLLQAGTPPEAKHQNRMDFEQSAR